MTLIVEGKTIAQDIYQDLGTLVREKGLAPVLDIFWVGDDKPTETFVRIKESKAKEIGVLFREHHYRTDEIRQEDLISKIRNSKANAVVVQLPLPKKFNVEKILSSISPEQDIDLLNPDTFSVFKNAKLQDLQNIILPPVAGAVLRILKKYDVSTNAKRVAVIGNGKLVGQPVSALFYKMSFAELSVLDKDTNPEEFKAVLKSADIVVSGTGIANIVTPELIKEGVVLIDAGTSSQKAKGVHLGDISADCAQKASLFARSPGGVGPITVAILYENLIKTML